MVKETNQRVMITLPKKCLKGLEKLAELNSTTISKIVLMMVSKKSDKLFEQVKQNCSLMNQMTLFDLANIKWWEEQ